MKRKSWLGLVIAATISVVMLLSSNGCDSCRNERVDTYFENLVVFQYEHVANVYEIRFQNKLELPGYHGIGSVRPSEDGFWAVFVLCSLDVQGKAIKTFNYNASNFFVEYEGESYGPLQPFTVRYGASPDGNNPTDTPKVAAGIAREVQLGPSGQSFPRGFYPSLNYRIAVLIPKALPNYIGEQLTLKYAGQPSILEGRGHSPRVITALGTGNGFLSERCRPLLN